MQYINTWANFPLFLIPSIDLTQNKHHHHHHCNAPHPQLTCLLHMRTSMWREETIVPARPTARAAPGRRPRSGTRTDGRLETSFPALRGRVRGWGGCWRWGCLRRGRRRPEGAAPAGNGRVHARTHTIWRGIVLSSAESTRCPPTSLSLALSPLPRVCVCVLGWGLAIV